MDNLKLTQVPATNTAMLIRKPAPEVFEAQDLLGTERRDLGTSHLLNRFLFDAGDQVPDPTLPASDMRRACAVLLRRLHLGIGSPPLFSPV